jgi:hypothetical protein
MRFPFSLPAGIRPFGFRPFGFPFANPAFGFNGPFFGVKRFLGMCPMNLDPVVSKGWLGPPIGVRSRSA